MPTFTIVLIALAIVPFALFLIMKRPLIFPLGLYIMMVPVDPLLLGSTTTLTRLVAIASACALLLHMLISRRVLAPPRSWTGWALYILLASLTALWTIDSNATIGTITQLLQLFGFFTVVAIYPAERKDVRLVGAIVVASGMLVAIWGLTNYTHGLRFQERLSAYLNGTMIDPNHLAASLLLPIALAVGAFLGTRDVRLKALSTIATIVMVAALFLTGSRGGLIALAAMLLYVAWKTRYRLQILAFMAVGGLVSLLQPTVWDRFADKGLGAGSGRLFIWDVARLALKDHWLTGAGIGAFPSAYNHELFALYQPVFQGWSRPAHNAFLSATVEVGVLGGILHLYAWWRSWSDSRGNIVIEASIVGLIVASFFLDVLIFKYIWLALTMAVLVKNVAEPRYLRGKPQLSSARASNRNATRRLPWQRRPWVAGNAHDREVVIANISN